MTTTLRHQVCSGGPDLFGRIRLRHILTIFSLCLSVIASRGEAQGLDVTEPSRLQPFTFADIKNSVEIQSLQLSPDGGQLAYTVNWDDPNIWLVDTKADTAPVKVGPGQFAQWSPDGKQLAYYSRVKGKLQLWLFDVQHSRGSQLTFVAGGVNPNAFSCCIGMNGWSADPLRFDWAPNGEEIVFSSQVLAGDEAGTELRSRSNSGLRGGPRAVLQLGQPTILTNDTPPEWTLAGLFADGGFARTTTYFDSNKEIHPSHRERKTASQLFIVNILTRKVRQLSSDDAQYFTPVWSPDGSEVIAVSMEGRLLKGWGSGPTNLYAFDVRSGSKTKLTNDLLYKSIPRISTDGKLLSFFGAPGENLGRVSLYIMPAGGGAARDVSIKLDRRVFNNEWLPGGDSLAIYYFDGVDAPIAKLNTTSGDFTVLSGSEAAGRIPSSLTVSRTGAIAWAQSDPKGPARIFVLKPEEKQPYLLVDLTPELKHFRLGVQEIVKWKNAAGVDLEGILIKPVGFKPGVRYPLIVDAYPKLQNAFYGTSMAPAQVWANEGYAVFFPDADGPHVWPNPWKSSFSDERAKGPRGVDVAVDDVVSGVDELITRGIVDGDHMCIRGFSNGGAIVNQVVTKSNRFICAVSIAAAVSADWPSTFFLNSDGKAIVDLAGTTPWADPEAYLKLSAVFRLDKVSTPMLLADGDGDGGFLFGEIEMYNGLRYLGKEVTLLRYPRQEHGFEGAALRDFWKRENNFFDAYLKRRTSADSL